MILMEVLLKSATFSGKQDMKVPSFSLLIDHTALAAPRNQNNSKLLIPYLTSETRINWTEWTIQFDDGMVRTSQL